jgi:hypothetical protein
MRAENATLQLRGRRMLIIGSQSLKVARSQSLRIAEFLEIA